MKLYLGKNLRQLRRDRDLTQEELAEVLGVSYQSVSRWENDTCYPDMELIPMIASFFSVTVDQLLGVNQALEEQKVEAYLEQFQDAISSGDITSCIEIARKGVTEFPGNFALMNKLMYALFVSTDDDGNIPNWEENKSRYDAEITSLGETIMKFCPDQEIRLEATARLGFHHCDMGRMAQGRAVYDTLPPMEYCKEMQIRWGLADDERLSGARKLIHQGCNALGAGMYDMIQFRLLPDEDLIQVYEKIFALDRLVYDGDYPYCSQLQCGLAQVYARIGRTSEAIAELEAAAASALRFDRRPEQWSDNSLLMGEKNYYRTDYETSDTRPLRQVMAEKWMAHKDFDCIRSTPGFERILRMLTSDDAEETCDES